MDSALWTADRRVVDAENPWPGLLSFSEGDEAFFRGRSQEAEALGRLVLRSRLSVLFGLSGLGKSSLLQAGLFPRLRRQNVLPVYVRLDYSNPASDLIGQIKEAIAVQTEAAGGEAPEPRHGETLWEYFHRRDADFWSPRNRPLLPLLVFDQFEELFTLGRDHAGRDALIETLGDLAEGRPPASLKARLDAHPEAAKEFGFGRHHYKLLLSLREDFLPELEGLRDLIPAVARHRLRLRRMDGEAALAVVRQGGEITTAEVAERIVRFVAKAQTPDTPLRELQIEPALLSVVCRELNNKRQQEHSTQITAGLLAGSEEAILSGFYERSVADVEPRVRAFIEEELLVEGFRDSVALEKALSLPGVDSEAIDTLVDRRLVRIDHRDGVERLELTHDLLTGVIAASRDRRRRHEAAQEGLQARQEAERREQRARRKLRRSQIYSAILAVTMAVSLATSFYGFTQRKKLERSRDALEKSRDQLEASTQTLATYQEKLEEAFARAEEAIAAQNEAQSLHAAELEKQKDVERQLRALLAARTQERAAVEERLRVAEQAKEDATQRSERAQFEASARISAYSAAKKETELFDVVLEAVKENKISVIKVVRAVTSLGLKEAKELVDSAPSTILHAVSAEKAKSIATKLDAAGAKVQIKPAEIRDVKLPGL
ncbi:MAG: ribosomal protein L7/L12 [Acidobacteriota bacterium]